MEWGPLGAGVPVNGKGDIEYNLASDWSPADDPRLDQRLRDWALLVGSLCTSPFQEFLRQNSGFIFFPFNFLPFVDKHKPVGLK